MKEFWNSVQLVFAALGGWIGWFLGGSDGPLYALVAFVAIDYITGVLYANSATITGVITATGGTIGDSSTGSTVKNLPAGVYGSTLFVTYAGYNQPFQILIAHNGNMFVRRATGEVWTKWKTFNEVTEVAVSTMDSFHKIDILSEK